MVTVVPPTKKKALIWRHPIVPLFVMVGLTISLSLRQSREMVNLEWHPTVDAVKSTTTNYDCPPSEASTFFDLIFWSKEPILTKGRIDRQRIIVTRNKLGSEMDEVIQVNFCLCNNGTCPELSANGWTSNEVSSLPAFQRNKEKELRINFMANVHPTHLIEIRKLEAITIWSTVHQQHIAIPFYPAANITLTTCGGGKRSREPCPQSCPQNTPDLVYPYFQDRIDKICKSSDPDANPAKRPFGGPCGCESTCFTPETGDPNSTWPWKNASERELFLPHWNDSFRLRQIERKLQQGRKERRRGASWNTYTARFDCPKKLPTPTPLPIVGAYSHHLYYIPEAKLIFCGIPKVGVTEWVKFFRHVMGANDYLSLPHYKLDRESFLMVKLDYNKSEELWNDPSWTKAVFFRNPLERLLSAYMDKIVGESYTQTVFKIGNMSVPQRQRPVMTFEEFVDRIADMSGAFDCTNPNGLSSCTDPHWGPQMMTCGLDYLLPKFDFLGNFDYISEHTKMLLERVGLWEEYGATFDDGRNSNQSNYDDWVCSVPPPRRGPNTTTVVGFNQHGPTGSGKVVHATGSHSRFDEVYTPELMAKVRKAYALDFAVWDEISGKDAKDMTKGSDLKVVRDYCGEK